MRKLFRLRACDLPEPGFGNLCIPGSGTGWEACQGLADRWASLARPPSVLPVHLGLGISCVPDAVFGAGNTRWARQARPHTPGASHPIGRGEPYTSAQASKIWMLDVPGGDFPSGTVDENPLASAGNVGSIPVLGQSHMLQSN